MSWDAIAGLGTTADGYTLSWVPWASQCRKFTGGRMSVTAPDETRAVIVVLNLTMAMSRAARIVVAHRAAARAQLKLSSRVARARHSAIHIQM